MIKGWKKLNLESLGFVGRGKSRHRPRNAAFLYGNEYPFVQTADVKAANYKITSYSQMYSEEGLKQSKLWPIDTLCITIAANIADSAILGIEACFPDSVIGFIPDDDKADVRFAKYLFDLLQVSIKQISQGAAQDNLSMEKLRTIKFDVPPLATQRKIASILSAYDDLIENNLKRIALLEEQAQQTYEEWFVRFKFPGYENVEIDVVSGLPVAWERKTLGDFTEVFKGKNITKATITKGSVPVVAGGLSPAYYHNKPNATNPIITVSASGANAGFVNLYLEDIWASDCSFIDSKMTENLFFVYCSLINQQHFIYHLQKGAAQPHVYPKDLKKVEIVIPSNKILQEFESMVSNNFNVKRNLFDQNQLLKEAREILLPRLMSGIIDVDRMEINENLGMVAEDKEKYKNEKKETKTSEQFKEAVLLAMHVNRYATPTFTLSTFRYTKFSYLYRRFYDNKIADYKRKAAGPYNEKYKYKGPLTIALKNKYIKQSKGKYKGFEIGEKIHEALSYAPNYWDNEVFKLVDRFRYKKDKELETITTIDNAILNLIEKGSLINLETIKQDIGEDEDWKHKLEQDNFSDENINKAKRELEELFKY